MESLEASKTKFYCTTPIYFRQKCHFTKKCVLSALAYRIGIFLSKKKQKKNIVNMTHQLQSETIVHWPMAKGQVSPILLVLSCGWPEEGKWWDTLQYSTALQPLVQCSQTVHWDTNLPTGLDTLQALAMALHYTLEWSAVNYSSIQYFL